MAWLRQLVRSLSFRLNLWYILIFGLSGAVLLVCTYIALANAIERKDREVLLAQLKEYAAIYNSRGLIGLKHWLDANNAGESPKTRFFVRWISAAGETVHLATQIGRAHV